MRNSNTSENMKSKRKAPVTMDTIHESLELDDIVPKWKTTDEEAAECVPGSGFLHNYVEQAMKHTDAPLIYHVATSMTTACAVLGKASLMVQDARSTEAGEVPMRLWALIIGASGDRKSTAMHIGRDLMNLVMPHRILPADATMEKWQATLAEDPDHVKVLYYEELQSLIENSSRSYSRGLKGWLIESFSGVPLTRATLTRDSSIARPRVSVVGAVPFKTLTSVVSMADWSNGFLARFNMFGAERCRYIEHLSSRKPPTKELVNWINTAQRVKRINLPANCVQMISSWCKTNIEDQRTKINDDVFSSLIRLQEAATIYSGVIEASSAAKSVPSVITVTKQSVETALKLVNCQKQTIYGIHHGTDTHMNGSSFQNSAEKREQILVNLLKKRGFFTLKGLVSAGFGARSTIQNSINVVDVANEAFKVRIAFGPGRPEDLFVDSALLQNEQVIADLKENKINVNRTLTKEAGNKVIEIIEKHVSRRGE